MATNDVCHHQKPEGRMARARRALRFPFRLACWLTATTCLGLGFFAFRPEPGGSATTQASRPIALQGPAAIQQLKDTGGYDSLVAAIAATRYQIKAAPSQPSGPAAPFYANNPGQQLRAAFTPEEVRVNAAQTKTDGEELRLRLTGYGYGDQLETLTPGAITSNGNRISITRSAIRNPQSAITEWYVNKPAGLEQGFTLTTPPAHRGHGEWLRLALAIGSGWRATLRSDGQGALLQRQADGLALGYNQLLAYDAQGHALPVRMALEGNTLSLLVDDANAAYPITVDPMLSQQQQLTASDGAADDDFGTAVALDGNTALIGAFLKTVNANGEQGAAYVFVRNGTTWTQQQELTASDGAAVDHFGMAVALSGDTALVSASNASVNGHARQGAAYVFVRNGTTWSQQQKLFDNNGAASDTFGKAVALDGNTALIGANTKTVNANSQQGAAYVFVRNGTTWTQQQTLTANDGAAGDQFGFAVALDVNTALIGALFANGSQGAAYVFVRNGTTWSQQTKLIASDAASGDNFGFSVAFGGDTALVGAADKAIHYFQQGAAYVFVRNGTTWTQQQELTASDGAEQDEFGFSVALSGDTALVGAPLADVGGHNNQGAAYAFARSGATWSQQSRLTANDGAASDSFGVGVALSGDTVLVGARNKKIGANSHQGAAYVFMICGDLAQQQQLIAGDGAANDEFGNSVALSGDTALVGAGDKSFVSIFRIGAAYVFVRNGTTWSQQQELTAGDGAAGDTFGGTVALDGNTALIGAPDKKIGANDAQGAAYVFVRSGTTWSQQQELTAGSDGVGNDVFGNSVALSGDTALVGATNKKIGANDFQGAAYVFTRSGTTWTQQQRLTASDGATRDFFGHSVALDLNTALVGANGKDIGTNNFQGAAYVFTRSGTTWTQQQRLTAALDGTAEDQFGASVALSGETALVGAPVKSIVGNSQQGVAYVFTRSGTTWFQQQEFTASDGAFGDNFGSSVALDINTILVGASEKKIGANSGQGAAYVFTRSGFTWNQQQRLTASDGAAGDSFGNSVALSAGTTLVGADRKTIGANSLQGTAYVFACTSCPTITLSPSSLPNGAVGSSYNQTVTASGGTGPYQFSLSAGALPPGLALAQNGVLSGTPTTAGTYSFTLTATILNTLCPGSLAYTSTITPPPTPTPTPAATPTATPTVTPTATPTATATATPGSFGNISTRLQVGTGNNVLFAGFIIQGSASKTVLIRSAGPSLASFGVPGVLSNPQLELHDANNTIGTNDDWQTTQLGGVITSDQVAAIQNSGVAPADPAEPAIIATLSAGQYTAIVQGVGGAQGVATVEVYDLSPNNGATLANISTRGFIQTGDNVMIGGFIVAGQSVKVLVEAVGPSLIPFGINNALSNPRLELHDANGMLAGNDDWQTTQNGGIINSDQSAAIQATGLAPGNSAESAILATLAPGNYTAIAQGVNGGTGVGLVEVYALP